MKAVRIVKGDKITFNHGMKHNIIGTVTGIYPGGRYGNNYEVKMNEPKLVYGKMSYTVVLKRHEI